MSKYFCFGGLKKMWVVPGKNIFYFINLFDLLNENAEVLQERPRSNTLSCAIPFTFVNDYLVIISIPLHMVYGKG